MKRFIAVCKFVGVAIVGVAVFAALAASPAAAQKRIEGVFNGHRIIYPGSSIPQKGHHHTNYFFVDSDKPQGGPPSGVETPGSLACVYQLVTTTPGCNPASATTLPTGGWGAIAIVDAGYYPTAASDLAMFSTQYGIPQADFTQVWPGKKQPEVESDWEVEEALDIQWAHAMAPQAKLYLVVSKLCNVGTCATDPFWNAVTLATKLVKAAGGGVVSMSWGDAEWSTESAEDHLFKNKHVVYFASSGDSGLNRSIYPSSSPNVVSVGGTYFNRDHNGNFLNEQWYTNGGGGDLSPYEPRPSYQDGVQAIVGNQRGYPDISSDFCCAGIVVEGGWYSVGGTSWSSPTMAGIVNAAGNKAKGSVAELNMIYNELANPSEYSADFNDITLGGSSCVTGFDKCTGVGSPKTYVGK
ncbi:MAG TPA: S53 family peptidase [Terriglobales bacterium]|nr:S53 family peptidase [Terriglobales bacterium]